MTDTAIPIPAVDAWVDEEWTKHMALNGADA